MVDYGYVPQLVPSLSPACTQSVPSLYPVHSACVRYQYDRNLMEIPNTLQYVQTDHNSASQMTVWYHSARNFVVDSNMVIYMQTNPNTQTDHNSSSQMAVWYHSARNLVVNSNMLVYVYANETKYSHDPRSGRVVNVRVSVRVSLLRLGTLIARTLLV